MEKIKKNRALSFLIVVLVYMLAAVLGIVTYILLPFSWWINLLIADVVATVITYIFSVIFKNASVYDPYWSVQPMVILGGLLFVNGINTLRALLLIAVGIWGVRLTANWAYTFKSLCHQDWRYTMYEKKTGAFYPIVNFFGIHLMPTLIVYFCTLPAAYAFIYEKDANIGSFIFFLLSVLAVLLQGTADLQMQSYRKNRTTPFIRVGLWKYSRHPNYLGEILMWWGVALSVISVYPSAPFLALGALANTMLFLFISIPMADKRQSEKEGFTEYKSETRMLLPIKK